MCEIQTRPNCDMDIFARSSGLHTSCNCREFSNHVVITYWTCNASCEQYSNFADDRNMISVRLYDPHVTRLLLLSSPNVSNVVTYAD